MNPVDSLPVIAEIALGLAGFTAVVSVLRRPDDLVSALLLLGYSSATLILALIPFLFTAMGSESGTVWRLSSAVMLLFSVAGFASYSKVRTVLPAPLSSRSIAIVSAAALNTVLQLANALGVFGIPRFWPFLLGLLWYLVFCLAQFASLLFRRPGE